MPYGSLHLARGPRGLRRRRRQHCCLGRRVLRRLNGGETFNHSAGRLLLFLLLVSLLFLFVHALLPSLLLLAPSCSAFSLLFSAIFSSSVGLFLRGLALLLRARFYVGRLWKGKSIFSLTTENGPAFCECLLCTNKYTAKCRPSHHKQRGQALTARAIAKRPTSTTAAPQGKAGFLVLKQCLSSLRRPTGRSTRGRRGVPGPAALSQGRCWTLRLLCLAPLASAPPHRRALLLPPVAISILDKALVDDPPGLLLPKRTEFRFRQNSHFGGRSCYARCAVILGGLVLKLSDRVTLTRAFTARKTIGRLYGFFIGFCQYIFF